MKARPFFAAVAAAIAPALPAGWQAVPGQAPDFTSKVADMALYAGRLGGQVFRDKAAAEVLSIRLTLAPTPSLADSYLELVDVRDALAVALADALDPLAELGVLLAPQLLDLGAVVPASTATKTGVWTCEVKVPVERIIHEAQEPPAPPPAPDPPPEEFN